jgi:LuxR family transcriptional regulator, quorum-sensing system regulator CciR
MSHFHDLQDFVRLSRSARTLSDMQSLLEAATRWFGFTHFMLGHHVSEIRGSFFNLNNYPPSVIEQMSEKTYFSSDPVIRACLGRAASFQWSELGVLISLSSRQKEILTNAKRAGIGEGFTVPVGVPGERGGSCSFAARPGRALDERVFPEVQYVAAFAFEAARLLARGGDVVQQAVSHAPTLSPRQLECLVLVAQGKSDWEIGRILGLKKCTIHEYIENAKSKYGVASRIQLVLRSLFDEQIGFDDIMRH